MQLSVLNYPIRASRLCRQGQVESLRIYEILQIYENSQSVNHPASMNESPERHRRQPIGQTGLALWDRVEDPRVRQLTADRAQNAPLQKDRLLNCRP